MSASLAAVTVGAFSRTSNAYKQLEQLDNATVSDDVFYALGSVLRTSNIEAPGIVSVALGDSRAVSPETHRREPSLSLYLVEASYQVSGVDSEEANWTSRWCGTEFVRREWRGLCDRYGVAPDYVSDTMLIFIYNVDAMRRVNLVRGAKEDIVRYLRKEEAGRLGVYVSSRPAVSIVFPTRMSKERAAASGALLKIDRAVAGILKANDKHACFREDGQIVVEFLDSESSSAEMFGITRED